MNKKIKITAIQEPAIRYITTDGEKFEDPIRAEDHQYDIDTKMKEKMLRKIWNHDEYGYISSIRSDSKRMS